MISHFKRFVLSFMSLQFKLGDSTKGKVDVNHVKNTFLLNYPCLNGTECTYYFSTLPKGKYLLELWGAQGGNTSAGGVGGKGGYSKGILTLKKETKIYFYIGGQPANTTGGSASNKVKIYGGFNGGGTSDSTSNCNGGGGGTDVKLNGNTFFHRVIVAGGGGGAESFSSGYSEYQAGAGGGLEGQASTYGPSTNGGKQKQGGTGGYGTQGSFGQGGNHGYGSAGGGGGWYGGSGSNNNGISTGAAGGSGYTFNSTSYVPTNFKLTSEYYLLESDTIQGTKSFLSPNGVSETGHSGHGAIKITILEGVLAKFATKAKMLIHNFVTNTLTIPFLIPK